MNKAVIGFSLFTLGVFGGCGGNSMPPLEEVESPQKAGVPNTVMDPGEHMLVEPVGNPNSLLGRRVTPQSNGGYKIEKWLEPGCQVVSVDSVSNPWRRTYHQDVEKLAGFGINLKSIAKLKAQYRKKVRLETTVKNTRRLDVNLSDGCSGLVILSVKVGSGTREFQVAQTANSGGHIGWKGIEAGGGGKNSSTVAAKLSWTEPQAWAFTVGKVEKKAKEGDISVYMPDSVREGEKISPEITAGKVDMWLVAITCRSEDACTVFPTEAVPVKANDSKYLFPITATAAEDGGGASETLTVYGFYDKADFETYGPPGGNLSLKHAAEYERNLKNVLVDNAEIPASRWTRSKPFHYEVVVAEVDTDNKRKLGPRPLPPHPSGVRWIYSQSAEVYFSRTEITVEQFGYCVDRGKCDKKNYKATKEDSLCNWGHPDRANHPMNCVNWYAAKEYCTSIHARLPTEDEWQKEASGGENRDWPWGNYPAVSCSHAVWGDGPNTNGCGKDGTWPVCSMPEGNSVGGLCDMSGNVWEWTSSDYDPRNKKVLRGGSWDVDSPNFLSSSSRRKFRPGFRAPYFGIRCVMSATGNR